MAARSKRPQTARTRSANGAETACSGRAHGYPGAVRRVVLAAAAALTFAAPAHAATLSVAPKIFSPGHAKLTVSAHLTVPRQVGVSLVTHGGRRVGWIVPPARRSILAEGWDGRLGGKRVPDGNYLVRLVYRSAVLA